MRQGFTLVELLVVVLVIAILVSMIIVGFHGVGARAREARVKHNLYQIRSLAFVHYYHFRTFLGLENNEDVVGLLKDVTQQLKSDPVIHTSANSFCVQATLAEEFFCMDSAGRVTAEDKCNSDNYSCH